MTLFTSIVFLYHTANCVVRVQYGKNRSHDIQADKLISSLFITPCVDRSWLAQQSYIFYYIKFLEKNVRPKMGPPREPVLVDMESAVFVSICQN